MLEDEIRENVTDTESVLTILEYVKPKEYASLREDYKKYVESYDYSFSQYLFDVVIAEREYEKKQLELLDGVKYISEIIYERSRLSVQPLIGD